MLCYRDVALCLVQPSCSIYTFIFIHSFTGHEISNVLITWGINGVRQRRNKCLRFFQLNNFHAGHQQLLFLQFLAKIILCINLISDLDFALRLRRGSISIQLTSCSTRVCTLNVSSSVQGLEPSALLLHARFAPLLPCIRSVS